MPRLSEALAERVERVLADGGPLALALDGFESRPGQRRLAERVAHTLEHGGTLVAEAGTGTGKTLAYLVPAMLAGRRVLVSTGTRALQDQVFYKDLPALARALGVEVRAAYMKGRTNYLCLHRFERLSEVQAALTSDEQSWLGRITEWAAATETGDRSEIEDLPDDFPFWSELSATSEQCLGRDCPSYADCHITKMRDRAAEAEIVIVNHHLLCADAAVRQGAFGAVIPEADVAVIDEAHQLEDVVTQYFGVSLSGFRMDEFARDGAKAVGAVPAEQGLFAVSLREATGDAQHAAKVLFDHARHQLRRTEGAGDRAIITPDMADELRQPGQRLDEALETLVALLKQADRELEDLAALSARATAIRGDLQVLLAASDPRYVHFIEARGRGVLLRAAPIDVADIVRDAVIGDRHATVLTSATLTVESSFAYSLGRLGVPDADTLLLPSEFDFRTQALLYLPPDMPEPRSPGFNRAAAQAVVELLGRTRGRAFVLFTSYAAMHEVYDLIEHEIEWPLFVQGAGPRTALLRDFRATPNSVLLATSSFWQGIDVAGEALSCVIIDRLPFASPADPLVAARIAAVQARGGQPFHEYQVPLATLTLLQGLGRLIRTKTDRGVWSVLDPRITTKPYGRRFLASLPPAPVTTKLSTVERFFR